MKEIYIKPETLCSIWIMNHEVILRNRYEIYCSNSSVIAYIKKGEIMYTEPDMTFEEYAVYLYDNVAYAIEHNLN